jgi:ornithine cyclodeaminase/alanine dehydrogenase-like protein (mu-crystallin family)
MPLYVDEVRVRDVLRIDNVIDALRHVFRAQAQAQVINLPRSRAKLLGKSLNITAASDARQDRYAVKIYGGGNFHIHLYDRTKGLLATFEADWLGQLRTGAANGLAAQLMARPQSRHVALIGAGRQAVAQLLALEAVGLMEQVHVYARRPEQATDFCRRMGGVLRAECHVATSAEDAVAGADIVVTATTSKTPVFERAAVKAGAHINAMGANAANRMEIDPLLVKNCALIVTDDVDQARSEAGEFLALGQTFDWVRVRPLSEVIAQAPLDRKDTDITLYKSLGAGLEDLAAASALYDQLSDL